ncbi:MAG: DHHW family protein [Lachnospiraceae bacterium]|nr:DHHW family protein [Lachnospiraceae bacterium]
MKKYILKKKIFAVVFMLVAFGFSIINFRYSYEPLKELIGSSEDIKVADIEAAISSNLYEKMKFIETYSFVQVLMDKKEYNNFTMIKDEAGFLHYASFFREEDNQIFDYAMRVKRLQDYVEKNGTKVLFVVAPSKYDPDKVDFREGMPINDPTSVVNALLFSLNRLGVSTLDLGATIPGQEISYEETFFKTDHHWTIPAAFYATKEIVDKMKESFNEDLDPQGYYTNIENYRVETYKGGMLGSMGRKTGAVFSGVDDFTALWPKFNGDFSRESMTNDGNIVKSDGNFEKTFMNKSALLDQSDLYTGSQYALYLNELRIYEKIINYENTDGSKIFMIRDSYFSPVISFMMPMCGEIDAIWSLEESEQLNIENYVKENKFDYIIIEVYPYNINDAAFNYFK